MSKMQELIRELCPKGVEWKRMDEVFEMKNGYTPSKANQGFWENGDIPWFRMEDIRQNGRILSDSIQHITKEAVKGGRLFPANSFIMATTATIGEHALIIVDSQANQRFTNLTIRKSLIKQIHVKYLFYYLFIVGEWCKNNTNVSGFASVDMKKFKKLEIPLPPLEVQNEIVRILDTFTAHAAELQAELQARKEQYEYYRNKLLTFDENDERVKWMTLGEVSVNVCSGGTPSTSNKKYYHGHIPWLRTQEVDWKDVIDTKIKISEDAIKNSSAKIIPPNCVIVAMYGATAGKTCINKIPLTTNQACCNLEINKNIALYKYVYYWLYKEYYKLKALGEGSQSNISGKKIKSYVIPIPPLSEQQRIVSILDKFESLVNDLPEGLPAEIAAVQEQYEYYRNKLLTFKRKS